jgi:hypothetical protein
MIGKQVKVYFDIRDLLEVERAVTATFGGVILAERWPSDVPMKSTIGDGSAPVSWICPAASIDELRPEYVARQRHWVPDPLQDPVIEWWHPATLGILLYPGRLYYVPGGGTVGSTLAKPEYLITMADHLFRWIRKFAEFLDVQWGRERVGPSAASSVREGRLELQMNPRGAR